MSRRGNGEKKAVIPALYPVWGSHPDLSLAEAGIRHLKHWIPPHHVRGSLNQIQNDNTLKPL